MSERLGRSAAPFVGDAVWREGFRVSDLMLGLIDLSKKMPFGKWEKENTKGIMLPCADNKGEKGHKLLFVKR